MYRYLLVCTGTCTGGVVAHGLFTTLNLEYLHTNSYCYCNCLSTCCGVNGQTFISLESQSTGEKPTASQEQMPPPTNAQPSQQQQMTAQTMQQSLPDSVKKVVNFRMNSTSVGKDSTTALPASKLRDTWEIQVAAVSKLDGAEKLVQDWKKKGVTMFIVTITGKSGKKWYIVRTGRYDSKEKADAAAATFSKKLGLETIARPYGVF